MTHAIDINCDVGEGVDNELLLMPHVSSCSIACGGHAGNENTMRAVLRLAKQHHVKVGAHPSFPDRANFGRLPMSLEHSELVKTIIKQIKTLQKIAEEEDVALSHIKPHGALYNMAASDASIALSVIEAMKFIDKPIKLFVPYGSVISNLAVSKKIPIVYEAFADRQYNDDLTLVSRQKEHAVISDPDALCNHVLTMLIKQKVIAVNGVEVAIKADTFCVHGDNPKAIELIKKLSQKLIEKNIEITAYS